jgi:hypothetical protein
MSAREQKLAQELLRQLPKELDKEAFLNSVIGAAHVLTIYRLAIEAKGKKLLSVSEDEYDSASWSHKQAHRNGYNKAIEDITKLFPRP